MYEVTVVAVKSYLRDSIATRRYDIVAKSVEILPKFGSCGNLPRLDGPVLLGGTNFYEYPGRQVVVLVRFVNVCGRFDFGRRVINWSLPFISIRICINRLVARPMNRTLFTCRATHHTAYSPALFDG